MYLKNLFYVLIVTALFTACGTNENNPRLTEDFNFHWKFNLGDVENAQAIDFVDTDWREVRLPHDWSIEQSYTQENTAGATAFLPGGVGWYRKTFKVPASSKDKVTWIEFDGIYTKAEVWINGENLGIHPYGYTPFSYNLTKHLKYGETNTIAIKADRSAYIDCRWYPGSGIYRHVRLVTANKVHIPQWGTFITTPDVSMEKANVAIETNLSNENDVDKNAKVITTLFFEDKEIASSEKEVTLIANSKSKVNQEVAVTNPKLWNIESPNMYKAVSDVYVDDVLVDSYETPFGIRTFNFDKDKGFSLNGKNLLLKGVCLHHDGGLVGAAVPRGVWERRLKTLKEAGVNSIRTAHNPPSAEFLDICDEMGFLVQNEAFDEFNNPKDKRHNYNQQEASPLTAGYTEYFTEWAERDLKNMIYRDRNHPSIIMWSIGNEIEWTYPRYGNATGYWGEDAKKKGISYYFDEPPYSVDEIKKRFNESESGEYNLAETAQQLSKWIKEVDTTRPVTANLVTPSVSNFSGYADALDIVGLSYRQSVYDYCKRHYPDMIFYGAENWARYHEWKPVADKDFIAGIYLWTGINYLGESGKWPVKGSGSGLLDFAGFEKPSYHMFKTLWNSDPHIHITTQVAEKSPYKRDDNGQIVEKQEGWASRQLWGWQDVNENWNYNNGDEIAVEVYTNQAEVELFLNEKSLGVKKLADVEDHILKWFVPYVDGKITAKTLNADIEKSIETSGDLDMVKIDIDKTEIEANAYDVVHITIQLCDENGTPIQHDDKKVEFEIDGDVKLLGVDNGSPANVQDHKTNSLVTSKGKALLILQSNLTPSSVKVKAICEGVESEPVTFTINR